MRNGVLDDVQFGTVSGEPLSQLVEVGYLEALVIHDDEERGGVQADEVFLGDILFFGTHGAVTFDGLG
jgi:hypothetical protein